MTLKTGTQVLLTETLRSKVAIAYATELGISPDDLRSIADVLTEISNTPGGTLPTPKWEFSAYLPNRYEYTPTAVNSYGALYVLYTQAESLPLVTIDDEYFDNTWSLTKPAASESLNTYYAIGYDENSDAIVTDMLGVLPAKVLAEGEEISIYVSPTNVSAPAEGTATPEAPWVEHSPGTDTNAQSAYFTVRTSFESETDVSETEREGDTHERLNIGGKVTSWLRLPVTDEHIIELEEQLLDGLVGDVNEVVSVPGTRYPYDASRSREGDRTTIGVMINSGANVFRRDFTAGETSDIAAGKKFTLVLRVAHIVTFASGGDPVVVRISITAGTEMHTYTLTEGIESTLRFEIPVEGNVSGVYASASGSWTGAGRASGYVVVNSAELHERGSHEDQLEAWFDRLFDFHISNRETPNPIPTDLALYTEGAPGTVFRQASAEDRRVFNIVYDTVGTQTIVTGDHILVKFMAVGGTAQLDPVKTERLGNGRYRYTSPANRPVSVITEIPDVWRLNEHVETLVSGFQQSIARKLTEFDEQLQARANDMLTTAARNFVQGLTQRHVSGTQETPPTTETGFDIAGVGILAHDRVAHNEIPSRYSKIVFTSPRELDSEFKLDAPLVSTYADIGLEKIIVSGWIDLSEDTGFQPVILRAGYRTSIGVRDILRRNTHGVFEWNTRTAASGDRSLTYDQSVPTTNYHAYGYYDDIADKEETWDIPTGVNSVKLTLNLTENDNPMQSDQVITVDTTQDRVLGEQTVNFTDLNGNTRAVMIRWSYTLSNRRLFIQSGASRLPSHATYLARAHITIDKLKITVSRSVTTTVHDREQTRFVPVAPVSGSGISTSTEDVFFVIMQIERLSTGNAQASLVTKEMTSGTVISYSLQDLGIPYDEFDWSRLSIFDFRIKQWDTSVFYPSRDVYTDAELRSKAIAEAYGLGEVTLGSSREVDFDEFVLAEALAVPKLVAGELLVGGNAVLSSGAATDVEAVGTSASQRTQYDISGTVVYVFLSAGQNRESIAFFLEQIPATGTVFFIRRLNAANLFAISVNRVSSGSNRLNIVVGPGSLAGTTVVGVKEQ